MGVSGLVGGNKKCRSQKAKALKGGTAGKRGEGAREVNFKIWLLEKSCAGRFRKSGKTHSEVWGLHPSKGRERGREGKPGEALIGEGTTRGPTKNL